MFQSQKVGKLSRKYFIKYFHFDTYPGNKLLRDVIQDAAMCIATCFIHAFAALLYC